MCRRRPDSYAFRDGEERVSWWIWVAVILIVLGSAMAVAGAALVGASTGPLEAGAALVGVGPVMLISGLVWRWWLRRAASPEYQGLLPTEEGAKTPPAAATML